MWDLDMLHYLNEQAHMRAVARAEGASHGHTTTTAEPTTVFPLSNLARLLLTGPPSIAHILDLLENSEVIIAFTELVREFLPDREELIMTADIDDRIRLFAHHFKQRYFPLTDSGILDEYALEDFIRQIPVDLMGFSYENYHEFSDFRTGYILLFSIIENPLYEEGGRVPILAHVSDLLGSGIAGLIPHDGWTPDQLHELTDGTKFEGVGIFADWMHSQTGCWVLDANYDDYAGEGWYRDVVDTLTEQWPRVCEILEEHARIVAYIEENPKKRFLELLDILLDVNTNDFVVPDEQLPLPI